MKVSVVHFQSVRISCNEGNHLLHTIYVYIKLR